MIACVFAGCLVIACMFALVVCGRTGDCIGARVGVDFLFNVTII